MEKRQEISKKFKSIIVNRGLKYEEIGKKMGITRQGVYWVLNCKVDRDWSNKDIEYWCSVLKVDSLKIYEIRERSNEEERL